jgi:2-polyprenyl-6-hydroxyphenyl methylase/3-demethylubiquinone-9 3-methyltransferase
VTLRRFIDLNVRASRSFDRMLPRRFSVDGNRDFVDQVVPRYLYSGVRIADVGGGRHPFLDAAAKRELGAHVTGVDISRSELIAAPAAAYDDLVVADIAHYRGSENMDIAICQSVLEHVEDTARALSCLASMVRPGGRILIFVPCRNAGFARINLMLPENLKKRLLYFIFPETRGKQGFRSYYDRCTPGEFRRLAAAEGLQMELERYFWSSTYFGFLLPLHVLWRLYQLLVTPLFGGQVAESFSMVLTKSCSSAHVVASDVDGAGWPVQYSVDDRRKNSQS